jgi:hemoglobin
MTAHQSTASIYERIGGEAAIAAAVDIFYEKILADPMLAPYFAELDMKQQVKKQIGFMTWAFGGPDVYKYRGLTEAHRDLVARGVGHAHFDAVAKHLYATLEELDVAPDLVAEIMTLVGSTRAAVLAG